MKQEEPIIVELQITDIFNKCMLHIKNVTEIITLINHSLQNSVINGIQPLEVDALPIAIEDLVSPASNISPKEKATTWLFKKAFEELIVGTTESLIDAHKACKLFALMNETKVKEIHQNDVNDKLRGILQKPSDLHFPTLITQIEQELNISLPFRNEILSINKVRNCLVHGNGIVRKKDVNNTSDNCLTMFYIELIVKAKKDGELIEIKKEDKKYQFSADRVDIYTREKKLNFQIGENITIAATTFNNLSVTTILFIQSLFEKITTP